MGSIFFWRQFPPGPDIPLQKWTAFLDWAAWVSLMLVLGVSIIITVGYSVSAAKRKIREPKDAFAAYTPMYWLFLAALSALAAGAICWWEYADTLGESAPGAEAVSFEIALWTGLWTFLLSYAVMLIPGITPAKFRYRPRWLFYRNKGARP